MTDVNGSTSAGMATGPGESRYSPEEEKAREDTKIMVLESISDMLEDAWPKGEAPRKKMVKQLLLKWHPDKNPGEDEELATAATQHIHAEVERLEQGLPRHGSASTGPFQNQGGFDPRNPFSGSPTFQRYFQEAYQQHYEQMNRRRKEQQETKDKYRTKFTSRPNFSYSKYSSKPSDFSYANGSGAHNHFSDRSEAKSSYSNGTSHTGSSSDSTGSSSSRSGTTGDNQYQPPPSSSYSRTSNGIETITKLLKQAREDLRSADNDYEVKQPAYEWVCFKSHQAAEKALKAVNLAKNSTKSFSHDLGSLATIAKDEELKRTATKLQAIVGDNNKLYNLVFVDMDTIPHEEFTREMACDAMMCARDILDRAKEIGLQ